MQNKKINWVSILIYVSIAFLAYYLYKNDLLVLPSIHRPDLLILSFIVLFAGYFSNALTWHLSLKRSNMAGSYMDAVASIGLAVFGKYMPGKVWVILGRAAYISQQTGTGVKKLSVMSLNVQFIMLWVGMLFGTAGLFIVGGWDKYGMISLAGFVGLSLLVFSDYFQKALKYFAQKILKRDVSVPNMNLSNTLAVLPSFLLHWAIWSVAFYLLCSALSTQDISLASGLAFPLAATIGIMAVFAPGGLGIREGLIVVFLTLAGLDLQEATTISVAARLWFLVGEVFIFLFSLIVRKKNPPAVDGGIA